MRIISILKLALVIIVFHIYIYHTYFLYQEQKDMKDPACAEARAQAVQKGKKVSPEDGPGPKATKKKPDCLEGYTKEERRFKVFHVKI